MDRKSEVLTYLKARGTARLAEVAAHLGLSKQGALRHLEALQAQGLVEVAAAGSHPGPGRPEHVYRLGAAAAGLFPSGHRELAGELVTFMSPEQVERFFEARALRMEAELGSELRGRDLIGRVHELGRLASARGHMTETVEAPDGSLQLRHCNCPIGDVASRTGHACHHELEVYRRLLGAEVERTKWVGDGDTDCTYEITTKRRGATSIKGANVG